MIRPTLFIYHTSIGQTTLLQTLATFIPHAIDNTLSHDTHVTACQTINRILLHEVHNSGVAIHHKSFKQPLEHELNEQIQYHDHILNESYYHQAKCTICHFFISLSQLCSHISPLLLPSRPIHVL